MFTIQAKHSETVEINAPAETVHGFFSDIANFIDLMPYVQSIHKDARGIIHWKISADIPLVGSFAEKFAVVETESSPERIEWSPIDGEKKNLMRYAADIMPKEDDSTTVRISLNSVMRRNSATEFHLLAGVVGENLISAEMSRRIGEMLKTFVEKARRRIETQGR